MNDAERAEHAANFLVMIGNATEEEVGSIMDADMGVQMIAGLAHYAETIATKSVQTLGDAKNIAKAMITIGYLLRVAEEKASTEHAALAAAGGFRH